jgi:hypothetical protein
MKIKSLLLNSAMVLALSLLGYGTGKLIGNLLVGESNPPWTYSLIQPLPKEISQIIYLQSQYSEDPTEDTLYVKTEDGEFYSYSLFQDNRLLSDVDPTPWDNIYLFKCAPAWNGATDSSPMGDPPPVDKGIIDSIGIKFQTPPITTTRCYVLLDDGSLQVWTHSGNAKDLMVNGILKQGFMILGMSIGVVFSVIIIRYVKRKKELVTA